MADFENIGAALYGSSSKKSVCLPGQTIKSWDAVQVKLAPALIDHTSHSKLSATDPAHLDNGNTQTTPPITIGALKTACICIALAWIMFMVSLDMSMFSTAMPIITDEFSCLVQASWYATAFCLTNGVSKLPWATLYRSKQVTWVFLLSAMIFFGGSLTCALASSSAVLIVGKAINGLGASGLLCGVGSIIDKITEPTKRSESFYAVAPYLGSIFGHIAGPLISGAIVNDSRNWRWIFWILLPIGGPAALVIVLLFRGRVFAGGDAANPKWKAGHFWLIDPPGILLMSGGFVAYMFALYYGGQAYPWASSMIIGLLVSLVPILALFCVWEFRQYNNRVALWRLLRHPTVLMRCLVAFTVSGAQYLLLYYLPLYFQTIRGEGPINSGISMLPIIISWSLSHVVFGMVSASVKTKVLYLSADVIGSVVAVGACVSFSTLNAKSNSAHWITAEIFAGIGFGLAEQHHWFIKEASLESQDAAHAGAMIDAFRNFGSLAFTAAAHSTLINVFLSSLRKADQELDPKTVLSTGTTRFRIIYSSDQVSLIVEAYMRGMRGIMFILLGGAVVAFFITSSYSVWRGLKAWRSRSAKEPVEHQGSDEVPNSQP
ncbi:major facilitator superfamily-domain-containing protein [Podospora fimiseda]|uniref:Major facilitator superfamily-domain-containing protein n=1 Tax=Podospora fimiseda TaxID=252190 RepID=A0AAN7BJP5_9PEZI|nr:major facilitator superfamily-domain-containing protein [Podospora fimiseda]